MKGKWERRGERRNRGRRKTEIGSNWKGERERWNRERQKLMNVEGGKTEM